MNMKLAIGKKFRMPLPTTLGVMLVIVTGTAIAEEPIETPTVTDQAQAIVRQTDHRETSVNLKLDFTVDTVNNYMLAAMQDVDTSADIPEVNEPQGDNTGTDPRDFSNKFMPYYLYTKLENDLEVNQLNFFAMLAFTPRFAMTIDIAVAQKIDYSDLDAFKSGSGGIPGGPGFGPPASGGVPFDDLEDDGDVVGMGDLGLRFFLRPEEWEWTYDDDNSMGKQKGISLMPLLELTLPTATNDVIGGEALIVSPGFVVVADLPGDAPFGLGFIAMMNFFDFDAFKDDKRESTTRYRGRWFWMQPLRPPGPNLFDGIYVLTEFQPVYDFMESDFSFWIGPEFGKIVSDGFIIYAKPGWGIDTDEVDRDFTFEFGMRYFF